MRIFLQIKRLEDSIDHPINNYSIYCEFIDDWLPWLFSLGILFGVSYLIIKEYISTRPDS